MLAMVVHKVPAEDLVRPDGLLVEESLMYSALLVDSEVII